MSLKYQQLADTEPLIIKGCMEGNRTFQSKLYDRYAPQMMTVCMRYSKNREEAEEILQEGFYRVFKYIHQLKKMGSLGGWIRKIMVNSALQHYKTRACLHPAIQIGSASADLPDNSDLLSNLNAKEMVQLVQSLPTAYKLVFNLFVFEGFKHREIATMIGISEGTSKSNLSDARAILQKALTAQKKIINS